jgi:hypothetical protein
LRLADREARVEDAANAFGNCDEDFKRLLHEQEQVSEQ